MDLFADDPLVFKKLIYEMRFDEVSADYALFGTFYHRHPLPRGGAGTLAEPFSEPWLNPPPRPPHRPSPLRVTARFWYAFA